ncbi:acetate--CoA ligase family protein [Frankia sp. CNm7]|nr:acetate--CoA ligase family protein [Frankia nepalensis]MBL7520936.1 acetate--CoA ligase family protein [Frankia nepalensis]
MFEIYQQYLADPDSVSPEWREFLSDYHPGAPTATDHTDPESARAIVEASGAPEAAAAAPAAPGATVDGVLVAQQVTDAVAEVILGVSHQHPFGPTITYGLGGVFTEVFKDVSFGVPPFDADYARSMIEATKGVKLLRGTRGRHAGDIDALVDIILRVQALAVDLGDQVAELDINPILVRPAGKGAIAVDALVIPAKP